MKPRDPPRPGWPRRAPPPARLRRSGDGGAGGSRVPCPWCQVVSVTREATPEKSERPLCFPQKRFSLRVGPPARAPRPRAHLLSPELSPSPPPPKLGGPLGAVGGSPQLKSSVDLPCLWPGWAQGPDCDVGGRLGPGERALEAWAAVAMGPEAFPSFDPSSPGHGVQAALAESPARGPHLEASPSELSQAGPRMIGDGRARFRRVLTGPTVQRGGLDSSALPPPLSSPLGPAWRPCSVRPPEARLPPDMGGEIPRTGSSASGPRPEHGASNPERSGKSSVGSVRKRSPPGATSSSYPVNKPQPNELHGQRAAGNGQPAPNPASP
ncbi:basic salivary proline-rich protein 2-like [Antechinus flavipes]|uniref:basic salivary proline-rich protein 2-like n=1 Tax=Antechinus flavipes TaxID=38775 RepID=UPI002235C054|nr:basic salivary proline-rich protein 2-like [Antechinus flavipes]